MMGVVFWAGFLTGVGVTMLIVTLIIWSLYKKSKKKE